METIDFSSLPHDAKEFIKENSQKNPEEEVRTEAGIEDILKGPLMAANSLLEGVYITEEARDALDFGFTDRKNSLTDEEAEKEKDRILAAAVSYKTAYKVIEEAIGAGVLYVDLEAEEKVRTTDQIFYRLGNEGPRAFLSVSEGEESEKKYVLHVFGFEKGRFIANSEPVEKEELQWLKVDI